MPDRRRASPETTKRWSTTDERLIVGALVSLVFILLLVIALGSLRFASLGNGQEDTQNQVQVNRTETFQNRAVGCRILVALGQPLQSNCLSSEMDPYFDPKTVTPGTANTKMICAIAQVLDVNPHALPETCNGG